MVGVGGKGFVTRAHSFLLAKGEGDRRSPEFLDKVSFPSNPPAERSRTLSPLSTDSTNRVIKHILTPSRKARSGTNLMD